MAVRNDQARSQPTLPLGVASTIALVAILCSVILLAVVALAVAKDHSFLYFSEDPTAAFGESPFMGLLSHAGVLLTWGAAAAAALTSAFVAQARGWRRALPLLALGAGTAYLALDDLFLLHEDIYPDTLGIGQSAVYAVYGVAAIAFLWWFRDVFRERDWPVLALAVAALGGSVLVDLVSSGDAGASKEANWLEDGLKLFGLALWAAYLVRLAVRLHDDAYHHEAL